MGRLGLRQFLPGWPLTWIQLLMRTLPPLLRPVGSEEGLPGGWLLCTHMCVYGCECVHVCVHTCACVSGTPRGKSYGTPGKDPISLLKAPLPQAQRALSHRGTPAPYFLPCFAA